MTTDVSLTAWCYKSSPAFSLVSPFPSPVPICVRPVLFLALVQMSFGLSCGLIYPLTNQAAKYIFADLVFSGASELSQFRRALMVNGGNTQAGALRQKKGADVFREEGDLPFLLIVNCEIVSPYFNELHPM